MLSNQKAEIEAFIAQLNNDEQSVEFEQTIELIDRHYQFTPVAFKNGEQHNEAGTNLGSCKILAFAQLQQLSEEATLQCFGRFYRQDVLQHPDGIDHGNIRNFIKFGWQGVKFEQCALETI
ncbi:HopJ type III effector protein [Pseudoalteromonas sp. JBTF-M23]|uniref:HopJ type III effector protein n=1 Tax=Pseudoalteromonas caenipelagi TaxID=2726988 RepID=A0A849VAL5_9GAMM|nr:HopJ type III effector protein [Pseudoalteromonas caenipelagi]NOU49810.1 HopJ type III effector protein [Pseudoalteromonas caenipelagi]